MCKYFSICVLTLSSSVSANSHVSGHANPIFLLKKQHSDDLVKRFHTAQCRHPQLFVISEETAELCYGCILPQGKPSPRPSPSCSTRLAIVPPAVKPPAVPAYAAEQKGQTARAQIQPGVGQNSPASYTPPSVNSAKLTKLRPNPPPPPPTGRPPVPSQSVASKLRPDPPTRPPPPCPLNKPSGVSMFVRG